MSSGITIPHTMSMLFYLDLDLSIHNKQDLEMYTQTIMNTKADEAQT